MIVVLSDFHFGLEYCTLRDNSLADRLLQELARLKPEEVILLGDVFDFWDSQPEIAISESRHFLSGLSSLGAKIVYVPGNHDHHAKVMDSESVLYSTGSEPALPYRPSSHFFEYLLCKNVEVHYHEYSKNMGGKAFLFTHGHFFIGENSLAPDVLRGLGTVRSRIRSSVEFYRKSGIDDAELERILTEAYETLYWTTFIGGLKGNLSQYWYFFERLFFRLAGLDSLEVYFKKTYADVQHYLRGRNVDYVVFGHSHRAGIYSEPHSPLSIVNTGAWCTAGVYEPFALNCYTVIDGGQIKLKNL